ncbi:HK97-gp10 family putative phage morphogenesis protein [Priestia filamentosa]|uniref:HK97-gp10 family putative phage morphogenesis protein n=1 Tax=Priestia filamentosa TaxID=1402861 RepID=UPI000A081F5B|nr:HK97-gp10 family putative phage morphogenesis protein [Priestia filamentosa]OXS69840.1 hypothetical protein B1B01_12880 [Priestia filamentosa]SMF36744.1 phage protein, HK97 gp10 family [Priestia filamentosa]
MARGIHIKVKGDKELIRKLGQMSRKANIETKVLVHKHTYAMERYAKQHVAVDKGHLRRDIRSRFAEDGFTGFTFTMLDYARYVEFGTRPHMIRAKKAKVLTDGKRFFGKEVHHPGTRPQPFLFPAFLSVKVEFIRDLEKMVRRLDS